MLKRNTKERRKFGNRVEFPLVDSNDCLVPINRSRQPERRLDSYVLEEISSREFLLRCYGKRRRRGG